MSIKPIDFYNILSENKIDFFTGVPDSLLKEFCLCIDDFTSPKKHIITANEGNAIALAAGYYLAQKSIPLVYMQNSGLGNAINPLLSLCDPDVYAIPMVVVIGWRGEPGVKDEPQHVKQGKVQTKLLDTMNIPYQIISKDENYIKTKISKIISTAKEKNRPTVLLIKKGTFAKYKKTIQKRDKQFMMREKALRIILNNLDSQDIIISTTGKTSREIFELREEINQSHHKDFLTVGSMGHCSSIALGIAMAKPKRSVFCIDGDGSMLMHMGILTSIANLKPKNFYHILLNNGVHESVGGQETAAKNIELANMVRALGINNIFEVKKENELKRKFLDFKSCSGPSFLEIKLQPGSREDLGRPTIGPAENKINFMKFLDN